MPPRQRLHHELLLLALHDRKGTHAHGTMLHLGLGGALFTELLLEGRVQVVPSGRKGRKPLVEVVDAAATGDPSLDRALEHLSAKRRGSPAATVSRLGNLRDLRHQVARDLCRMGVLRATEQQVLLIFRRKVYPTVDPGPERALVERVRGALSHDADARPEERTVALISLAHAAGVLSAIYDRKELKRLRPRIENLQQASVAGRAVHDAVQAAVAAMVAVMAASTAAAASG